MGLREVFAILSKGFSDRVFVRVLAFCLVLAYAAEIGSYTFTTDYFFELAIRHYPYLWLNDGRYLGEFIRVLLSGYYLPSLLLMVGLVTLAGVGVLVTELWGLTESWYRAIAVTLLAAFPFFFESFSFFPLRHAQPVAIALAVTGIVTGDLLRGIVPAFRGVLFLLGALMLYQSATYFAAVVVLIWSGVAVLQGQSWRQCFRTMLLPKLALIVIAMAGYGWLVQVMNGVLKSADRLAGFAHMPATSDELVGTISAHLLAVGSFFVEETFLFPLFAKVIAVAGLTLIAFNLAARVTKKRMTLGNALFVAALLIAAPLAAHGANLVMYPPWTALFYRVLFGYSAVYVGIFAMAVESSSPSLRKAAGWIFGVAAVIFIYQANVWHQYLHLKNLADIDMARSISDRLKSDPAYRAGLPLAIIGTRQPTDYLVYREDVFDTKKGRIGLTISDSVYAHDWSKDRVLAFFLDFLPPSKEQMQSALDNSAGTPTWPAPGSTFIRDGVMVVVLGKEQQEQRYLAPIRSRPPSIPQELSPVTSCNIDVVEGAPRAEPTAIKNKAAAQLSGWAGDVLSGTSPSAVFIELEGPDKIYVKASRGPRRPDVVAAFHRKGLMNSGWEAYADLSQLPSGSYKVRIIQFEGNSGFICEKGSLSLN